MTVRYMLSSHWRTGHPSGCTCGNPCYSISYQVNRPKRTFASLDRETKRKVVAFLGKRWHAHRDVPFANEYFHRRMAAFDRLEAYICGEQP